jgi:hypothetical protein
VGGGEDGGEKNLYERPLQITQVIYSFSYKKEKRSVELEKNGDSNLIPRARCLASFYAEGDRRVPLRRPSSPPETGDGRQCHLPPPESDALARGKILSRDSQNPLSKEGKLRQPVGSHTVSALRPCSGGDGRGAKKEGAQSEITIEYTISLRN